jgi:hypothetical protein
MACTVGEIIRVRHDFLTSSYSNWTCNKDYIRLPQTLARQLQAQQLDTVSLF